MSEDAATKAVLAKIEKQVVAIAREARHCVERKVELGRLILALRQMHGDVDLNGRKTLIPALKQVMAWMKPCGEIPESTLRLCAYVAERTESAQIKILADAGASFSAIHASVAACEQKGVGPWVRYVADVHRGHASVASHLMAKVERRGLKQMRASRLTPVGCGAEDVLCRIVIRGDEPLEVCENSVASLLSALKRMGQPVKTITEQALNRVLK